MKFGIQVSNPKVSGEKDPDDETLDECVETSFLLNTEMAIIRWLGVFIPLHYKYSISTMMPDIIMMLQLLMEKSNGKHEVTWPSSDFNATWVMSWQGNDLTIDARWNSVIGKTESILNDLDTLTISKSDFISEWKGLLGVVLGGLVECGYNETNVNGFESLEIVHSRINKAGLLYR